MNKKILILSLVVLSQSALSASNPTKFVMVDPLGQTKLYTPKDQGVILANLQNVSKNISGGSINLPVELPVVVPKNYDNAFFDPMSFMLISPYQLRINGATKNPVFSRTVEMHEYGHAVLDQNIETVFKHDPAVIKTLREFDKLRKSIRPYMRISTQARMELELLLPDIDQENPDVKDPKVIDALRAVELAKTNEEKVNQIASSNEALLNESITILQSFVAYNEFFADVVAVIITGNPQAIEQALTLVKNKSDFSDRGFRVRISKRAHSPEVHNFLTLSREYIYKYYLSDAVVRSKGKSWILSKTLESISCALKNQNSDLERLQVEYARGNVRVSPDRFLLEGMNKAFNNCIDQKFKI